MKKILLSVLAVTALLSGGFTALRGPSGATNKASKSRGAGGNDPNIKSSTYNQNAHIPRPVSKGGHRTRGAARSNRLHVDNRTGYYVDIYIDGDPVGNVSPYGDSYGYVRTGPVRLYAKAPGTDLYWGPRDVNLEDGGSFTWTLTGG